MKSFATVSILITLGWGILTSETLAQTGAPTQGSKPGKDILQQPPATLVNPVTFSNEIQPQKVNLSPVQIEYSPLPIERNEPKEANPVYLPVDYQPEHIDRNEPKEDLKPGGQTRVDADSYEPDNTAATAHYISVTSTLQSENHTIHDFGGVDIDWYYFSGIPGRTYTFYSTSSLDNRIYLYQNDGTTVIDFDDDDGAGNNFYLEFTPTTSATFRLKVDAYYMNAGPYVFYFKTGATPDSYEIDDAVATAKPIFPSAYSQSQSHTIHSATDVDWYYFTGLTGRTYTFYSTGNTDVRLWLYASDGTTQLDFDDDDGDGNNFYLQYTFTSNATYYLKVDPYTGNAGAYAIYFVYESAADAYEPNDTVGTSTDFVSYDSYTQSQSHTIHTHTDQDWFNFLALEGVDYIFWSTGNTDTQIYIYSSGNLTTPVIWDDNSGDGNNFYLPFLFTTTASYYVKIVSYNGDVGAYNFLTRHEDDPDGFEPDDNANECNVITPGLTEIGHACGFHNPTDQDWYRFQGLKGYTYTFWSTRETDTQIYLYLDNGTTQIGFDDDSGDGNNFYLQYIPTTTAYYKIKLVAYGGGVGYYFFNFICTVNADAFEPDNSASAYITLIPTVTTQTQEHTLHLNTDQDWFRFQAVAGRLYTFASAGPMDNLAYLYQDDGTTLLTSDDDSGEDYNFSLVWNCPTSGYYKLKVIGYTGALGYYLLSYIYGAVPDSYEPDNTSATAAGLTLTAFLANQSHTLHTSDEDWFRFQGVATKRYTFYSTGDTDTYITLYQDNGTTVIASDDDNGDGTNFNLQYVFSTTAYYKLKVNGFSGAAGSYGFYFIFGAQPDGFEPDDSATQFTTLNVTTTPQSQTHTIDDAYDVDWFRFQGVAGQTYTFYSTGTTDMRAHLYQDNGTTQLAFDDNSGTDSNFNLQFIPTTTAYYKLRVSPIMNEAGPYGFHYFYSILGAPVITDVYLAYGTTPFIVWSEVPGATSYKIYHSNNPYTGFTLLLTTTSNALLVTDPTARKFYRITANN